DKLIYNILIPPCAGQQVQLILHVRKFFCDTTDCARKIFAERLPQRVAPWAQMTTRLCRAIQAIGLATCGRLGARLASRFGMTTSWMTVVRRVMALPREPAEQVQCEREARYQQVERLHKQGLTSR